jgi:hypothetical protein
LVLFLPKRRDYLSFFAIARNPGRASFSQPGVPAREAFTKLPDRSLRQSAAGKVKFGIALTMKEMT